MTTFHERFQQQRARRYGAANPERMHVPHWEWMVRNGRSAYDVACSLDPGGDPITDWPKPWDAVPGPDWCFRRYGRTRTPMTDGRIICIGGEHEDGYDPDFCIYNDVVILRPDHRTGRMTQYITGSIEIYGYPPDIFPPTDFHTATLVGDRILIIGRLGYSGTRQRDTTPVYALDTETYRIEPIATTGRCPGWIYVACATQTDPPQGTSAYPEPAVGT